MSDKEARLMAGYALLRDDFDYDAAIQRIRQEWEYSDADKDAVCAAVERCRIIENYPVTGGRW